ncbi:hypothetical protein L0P88_13010 [Muricauda sp. SCSIO 64092]|uniref:sugar-binding protein n=1 Tax=Allomuricauda sp. SCSIO 64092 TaxID=2908842 RepID=UPI001FF2C924|nr:sugar-binding protein [Muricauda sp. SCSIO 64092]UOY04872.1 hypothetical protein L0P88_13010 [Muricauda sp. SCSIO 64092]
MRKSKQEKYIIKGVDFSSKAISKLPNGFWETANVITDFKRPWENTFCKTTVFRALHSNEYVYLNYVVMDDNILLYDGNENVKIDVAQSDRVEIFFRSDKDLKLYYGIEIDAKGRVLDYSA